MKEVVFLNGRFTPSKEARLLVLTPGFLYGFGLFETMRSYYNRIAYLNQHLRRLNNSCKLMDMRLPYTITKLKEALIATVKINAIQDAHVRLTLWKSETGTDVLITARKYQPFPAVKYRKGFCAGISRFRQDENSYLAQLKTTNRILYQLSLKQAQARGFDETIILNHRGHIVEASRSNLFLVKERVLFTPDLKCGCLDGITRQVVFDLAKKYNIKIYAGSFTPQDLYDADEAFLTNSLMGIMPLGRVEKRPVFKCQYAKSLARFFMEKYNNKNLCIYSKKV